MKGRASSRDGGPPQRCPPPPRASNGLRLHGNGRGRFGARPQIEPPIGQRAGRPASRRGGGAVGPLEGRDWSSLETPGKAEPLLSRGAHCFLVTRAAAGKRRPLRRGSGVLPPRDERPLISSSLYQRGLHELGAGARRPARRRGESGPAPSGLEVFPRASAAEQKSCPKFKLQGHFFFIPSWCRRGRAEAWCLAQKAPRVRFPGAVVATLNPPPLPRSRPRCSCLFFGCLRSCRWLPACCCYPELCCPWLQEALRPSPLRPLAPATFQDQSLQPSSLVPTKKSPRRSPGGDLGLMTYEGELGAGATPGRAHSDLASPSGQW